MINISSTSNIKQSELEMFNTGTSSVELMGKAGKACAHSFNFYGKVAIVCGKGNNAGDGYVLALELIDNKIIDKNDLTIYILFDSFSDSGKFYFDKCKNNNFNIKLFDEETDLSKFDIVVDAILGVGVKSGLSEQYIQAIDSINKAKLTNEKLKVVSIDINSGLNSDIGIGTNVVVSDMTLSIGYFKPGHYLNMAKDVILDKKNLDIGIKLIDESFKLYEENDIKKLFNKRLQFSHKGSYGKIAIVGGSTEYSGAIRLANMSLCSLRAGVGMSTIAVPKYLIDVVSSNILESMIYPIESDENEIIFDKNNIDNLISKVDAITIGMGLGRSKGAEEIVKYIISNFDGTLILDADALYILSKNIDLLINKKPKIIITPHIKEYERLLLSDINRIYKSELINNINIPDEVLYSADACKSFAKKYDITILLKGPTSIITDGKNVAFVDRGSAGMATAGSGDVLSGILSGMIFQIENSFEATVAACFVNGMAGEYATKEYGEISMLSSDTTKNVAKVIKHLTGDV